MDTGNARSNVGLSGEDSSTAGEIGCSPGLLYTSDRGGDAGQWNFVYTCISKNDFHNFFSIFIFSPKNYSFFKRIDSNACSWSFLILRYAAERRKSALNGTSWSICWKFGLLTYGHHQFYCHTCSISFVFTCLPICFIPLSLLIFLSFP